MANFITILRIIVTPIFAVFIIISNSNPAMRFVALALFMFGAFTDWADGQIARRTETVSEFGKSVDPVADRLFIGVTLVVLYCMRILPLAFMVVVLGRDLLMAAGYPIIGKIDKSKIAVHWSGKVATAILFWALTCLVLSNPTYFPAKELYGFAGSRVSFAGYPWWNFGWQMVGLWFFVLGMLWSLYSGGIYVKRALELARDNKNVAEPVKG